MKKRLSKKLKGQQKRKKRRECLSEKSHSQKSTRVPNINDSIKHIIYYISLDIYIAIIMLMIGIINLLK